MVAKEAQFICFMLQKEKTRLRKPVILILIDRRMHILRPRHVEDLSWSLCLSNGRILPTGRITSFDELWFRLEKDLTKTGHSTVTAFRGAWKLRRIKYKTAKENNAEIYKIVESCLQFASLIFTQFD
jgi:hypothetical protein